MKLGVYLAAAAFGAAVLFGSASADPLAGRVVRVLDGDTIDVLDASNQQTRVRLANIDCPERSQPWGRRARERAAELMAGEHVTVSVTTTDRYGRSIGLIEANGVKVNRALVAEGHCWVYERYNTDRSLPEIQARAAAAGLGLWALPESERQPPWDWRRQ